MLKPCRVCGSQPTVITHRDPVGNPAPHPEDGYGEIVSNDPKEAEEVWNRLNA